MKRTAIKRNVFRRKKCKNCKEWFLPTNSTLQEVCFKYGPRCAIELVRAKAAKKKDKEFRERKRALKSISHWLKLTQKTAFNPYILLRDKNDPCYSCGDWDAIEYHAGHFRSIGAASQLRFTEDNCWKQCAKCNTHMSGNVERFRVTLVNKIGLARVEALENDNSTKSWTPEELDEKRKYYRLKIREMK